MKALIAMAFNLVYGKFASIVQIQIISHASQDALVWISLLDGHEGGCLGAHVARIRSRNEKMLYALNSDHC